MTPTSLPPHISRDARLAHALEALEEASSRLTETIRVLRESVAGQVCVKCCGTGVDGKIDCEWCNGKGTL